MKKPCPGWRAPGIYLFISVILFFPSAVEAGETVSLEDCLSSAAESAPGMLLAEMNLQTARNSYDQAVSGAGLSISGTGGLGYQDSDELSSARTDDLSGDFFPSSGGRESLSGGVKFSTPNLSGGLSAVHSLPADDPGRGRSSLSLSLDGTLWDGYPGGSGRAELEKEAIALKKGTAGYDAEVKDFLYAVKQAYYAALASQRVLALREEVLKQRQDEEQRITVLIEAGKSTRLDTAQASINVRTAQLEQRKAQGTFRTARARLSALLGWDPGREYTLAEPELREQASSGLVPGEEFLEAELQPLVQEAWERRAELLSLSFDEQTAAVEHALLESRGSPVVNAGVDLSWEKEWQSGSDSLNWGADIGVSFPISDAGLTRTRRAELTLRTEISKLKREQLRTDIAIEVEERLNEVAHLAEELSLRDAAFRLAQDQHELALLQQEAGMGSNTELLEASVNATDAWIARAEAVSDLELAVLALEHSLGS